MILYRGIGSVFSWIALTAVSMAQSQDIIQYDKNDPDLLSFRAEKPGGESSVGGARIKSLALPALDFKDAPVAGTKGFESGVAPHKGKVMYDNKTDLTYSVRHVYNGITLLVNADLRVPTDFSGQSPPFEGNGIVVIPAHNSDQDDGIHARVIVYRFKIPYSIDIECEPKVAETCFSEKQLQEIGKKLQLVSVPKEK